MNAGVDDCCQGMLIKTQTIAVAFALTARVRKAQQHGVRKLNRCVFSECTIIAAYGDLSCKNRWRNSW